MNCRTQRRFVLASELSDTSQKDPVVSQVLPPLYLTKITIVVRRDSEVCVGSQSIGYDSY